MDYEPDSETGGILIPLSSKKRPGMFAIVDRNDVPLVSPYLWWPRKDMTVRSARYYADSSHYGRRVLMHRLILGVQDGAVHVDHINHNGLDNRRCNLRVATQHQNQMNRRPSGGRSPYKGVYWNRMAAKWNARLQINGKKLHLGYFTDEREAALAVDAAARFHLGEFAYLNFPDESEARS